MKKIYIKLLEKNKNYILKKIIKKFNKWAIACPYGLTYTDVDIMRPGYKPVSTKT